ncbi:carcinine hydrolase/isopenicillin-N N-acyltransferase family protein [Dyadobacter chenwenxiniae]|uniref:Carcinine hydrolase/isopenicillin-N N-acyltransferase family protein n=1 Tax=Dyadobacter chenwenxiniae TaxID=2906456 RepID=A0A9X1PNC2_9BACT|nr:carcinine hydrolase/isopenicillin-N N-acyltransferase family protein [Dyadobacter chenwenxiniae]MCF0064305.1 carcinine hydrolase/isopenicillin-N N-acyltransferase family protein [Dyadobacter chenwenxiniae]UON82483.1 carcinine hydrolase/isopenicillin-N N-acyltransferase family protein [Dyadobacter chenwenxiniae]
MFARKFTLLLMACCLFYQATYACTIFTASDGKTVLVGNNEDASPSLKSNLWFYPARQHQHGFVTWGAERKLPEGGMNEKGLFWDAAALPTEIPIKRDASKPDFKGYFVDKALSECTTVEEVVQLLGRYNLVWQQRAQILVADAIGDYAIIHANYIIRKSDKMKPYQAVANFSLLNNKPEQNQCHRYRTAEAMLDGQAVTEALFKTILAKTAQHSVDNATIYSQIANLTQCKFTLFQRHRFEQPVTIVLTDELKKGAHQVEMKSLFPLSIREKLEPIAAKQGAKKAVATYHRLKNAEPGGYDFGENELDELGFALLDSGKLDQAVEIFALNQSTYPESDRALSSLAQAYLVLGNREMAGQLFKRALSINPSNLVAGLFTSQPDGKVTFRISSLEYAQKISLVGSFNNWDTHANPFTKTADGQWECKLSLKPGTYEYVFLVGDNNWMTDPGNRLASKPGQYWRSILIVH